MKHYYDKNIIYLKAKLKDNQPVWFIAKCKDVIKYELLNKKIALKQQYDLLDYAEIINNGFEPNAPREALEEINLKYGTKFTT